MGCLKIGPRDLRDLPGLGFKRPFDETTKPYSPP